MIPDSASGLTRQQRDRFEQLDNDIAKRRGITRVDFARSDEEAGRFAVEAETPAEQYPAAASPWSGPQVGLEPPLPDNDMGSGVWLGPPLGEPHEVKRAEAVLAGRLTGEANASALPPDSERVSASEGSTSQDRDSPPPAISPARADGMPCPTPLGVPQSAHDALRKLFARRV